MSPNIEQSGCPAGGGSLVYPTDPAIDVALSRGAAARKAEPRAAAVRYDRALDRVLVDLTNGCSFAFPPRLAQELQDATVDQIAEVEVLGAGSGLHWEALDVDLSLPGLMAGLVGTAAHMAGRAGRATSPAKASAARTNGARGGRPRRSAGG